MQKKILHITQFLSPGGLERMILTLSVELNHQGHASEVFVYDREGEKTLLSQFSENKIKTHVVQKDPGLSWKVVKSLRKLIKEQNFDAIHSHDLGALIYASFANMGLNVVHVHTQHSFIHFQKSWTQPIYEKIFTLFPDTIVTVSPHQVLDYQKLHVKAVNITNGISFPNENPYLNSLIERRKALLSKADFRQTGLFGEKPGLDQKWLLVPGRIQKSKGQTYLFDILKKLNSNEREKIHFIIIGAPTYESERLALETLYKENPDFKHSISYLGFQSNPLEWMTSSDGVLLLSEFEGFPLVPLESLGLGLPTLLSDIEPHRFLKDHATLTSLEDLGPAVSWCQQIAMNKQTIDWGKSSPFRESHSIKKMASDYLKLYEKKK